MCEFFRREREREREGGKEREREREREGKRKRERVSFYLGAMSSDEQRAWEREWVIKKRREERKICCEGGEVDDNMTSVGIDECRGG